MRADSDLLYISTSSVRTDDVIKAIGLLSDITGNIELSGGSLYDADLLKKLTAVKRQNRVKFLLHSYFPPPLEHFILNFADTSEKTRTFISKTLGFIYSLDVDYYSVHAGFSKEFTFKEELLYESGNQTTFTSEGIEKNLEWFQKEFPDKKIALENLYPNNNNKECGLMMHVDEVALMMDRFAGLSLLLDLGHLKISSRLLGFNYLDAVELLFERYGDRIKEIHLSENNAELDDHFTVYSDSVQYMILKEYAGVIRQNKINVTIESRKSTIEELRECFALISGVIGNVGAVKQLKRGA